MFSLFSNKNRGGLSIILDIQSGLVRGALIRDCQSIGGDEKIHIESIVTKSISTKTNMINAEHLTKRVLKLVSEVVEHLSKNTDGQEILEVNYVLSSPWIFSKLKHVKLEYEKEIEITSKILSDIVKEEVKNNTIDTDTKPIEQKIFEIKLNGYLSEDFKRKKAHTLDVSVSTSFSSKTFVDRMANTVNKHVHAQKHNFYSALLMQYTALREILENKNEFIYIHIHSEITDIIVVKDSLCKHISSFPFGISTFLRKIAHNAKQTIESSDSLLTLFHGNKLEIGERDKVYEIINPLLKEWGDMCFKSFKENLDEISTPRTIYLHAHSHFDVFKESLLHKDLYNFDVIPYETIDVGDKVVFSKGAPDSVMMRIYALAINRV